jgi:hypothetical protein
MNHTPVQPAQLRRHPGQAKRTDASAIAQNGDSIGGDLPPAAQAVPGLHFHYLPRITGTGAGPSD